MSADSQIGRINHRWCRRLSDGRALRQPGRTVHPRAGRRKPVVFCQVVDYRHYYLPYGDSRREGELRIRGYGGAAMVHDLMLLMPALVQWWVSEVTEDGEMNRRYVVGAIVLGIAACTTQGPEMPESSAMAASGVVDDDTLICKRIKKTGSLMRKEICMSAAEWDRLEEDAEEFKDKERLKATAAGQ